MQGFWVGCVIAAVVLTAGVLALNWVRRREIAREFGEEHEGATADQTQIIDVVGTGWDAVFAGDEPATARASVEDTAVIRVAPVAERPARKLRLVRVEDELGSWVPGAHVQEEPLVLGAVFAAGSWAHVKLADVGLEAS